MTSKTLPLEPIRGFNNASGDKINAFCFDLLLENKWTAKQGIGYLYSHSEKMKKETFGCKCNKAWSELWLCSFVLLSKTHQPEWNSFFMVWAAGKCKIKTPADPVSGRAALCLTDGILRLCPHIRDSKQVPCVLFYRVIIIPVLLRVLQKTDRKDSEGVSQICIHDTVWVVPQKLSSQWTGWA